MKKAGRLIGGALLLIALWAAWSLWSHAISVPYAEDYAHHLRVMTYNTHGLGLTGNRNAQELLAYVRRQNADIICMQEVSVYKHSDLLSLPDLRRAMQQYPYTYYDFKVYNRTRQFGNVVFSRYPLIHKHTISYPSRANISSCCDVVVGEDTLRLMVNHLESYRIRNANKKADTLSLAAIKDHPTLQKIGSAYQLRCQQARAVREEIDKSPYPVVVVGDLNAPPTSYVYWKIKAGLRDCFSETGIGQYGATYTGFPIGVRIDYILCSRSLHPTAFSIDKVPYSDHYPILSTLCW